MTKKKYATDKNYRSIIKAVSYRIVGTIATVLISFAITGNFKFAVSIGGIELFSKIAIYYLHERMWERIKLGKVEQRPIDYEI